MPFTPPLERFLINPLEIIPNVPELIFQSVHYRWIINVDLYLYLETVIDPDWFDADQNIAVEFVEDLDVVIDAINTFYSL